MQSVLAITSLLILVLGVDSQCTGKDAPNCVNFKNNGFCTNAGYSLEKRKLFCGVTCGFCNRDGIQTAAGGGRNGKGCVDANANCTSWAATLNFCTRRDVSNDVKLRFCCATCRPIIFASTTSTMGTTEQPTLTTDAETSSLPSISLSTTGPTNELTTAPIEG